MASRKKSGGFFNKVGMLAVVGVVIFGFASYRGWIKTNTDVKVYSDKATDDTKAFIKTITPESK